MEILIVRQEIGVRKAVIAALLLPGPAETDQHDASFVGSEGVQGSGGVLEKLLEQVQLLPLDFIERRQPAQVLIQKTQLLMDDNGFGVWGVFALADFCEFNALPGVALDGVDLGAQEVDLSLHLLLDPFHLRFAGFQLSHHLLLFFIHLGPKVFHLALQFRKLANVGVPDVLHFLFKLVELSYFGVHVGLDSSLR